MSATTLMIIFILIISIEFIFEKVLAYLNYRDLKDELPEALKDIYDPEKYRKSIAYNRENARFGFLTSALSFTLILVLIITGFFGVLDAWIRSFVDHEILVSLVFFGLLFIASDILNTPFALYDTFVIE
jgi:STE24 endopeptidase